MMNKKVMLFCGVSLCAGAMVASVLASSSIGTNIFNNKVAQAEHTFVIPSSSSNFSEKSEKLSAYATSPSGYQFELEFTGFQKEGDDLTLAENTLATVTNVLPLDLGFDTFQAVFSSNEKDYKSSYSAVFFSYHQMTLEGIINGTYGDMYSLVDFDHYYDSLTLSVDSDGDLNEPLPNYRYMFAILEAEGKLTFEGMTFSSQCSAPAIDPGDDEFEDYSATEKSQMSTWLGGEVPPFVGNGAYTWKNSEQGLYGYFFNNTNGMNFLSALEAAGYTNTYSANNGNSYAYAFQKKAVYNEENIVRTIMLNVYGVGDLLPYEIHFTTAYDYLGSSDEWPVDKFEEVFSSSFASFLEGYPFSTKSSGYQYASVAMTDQIGNVDLQILISNTDFADISEAATYAYNYWTNIVNHESTYALYYEDSGSEYYSFAISDNSGLHSISFSYSNSGCYFSITEKKVLTTFPEEAINNALGGVQCVPYEESGTFVLMNSYSPIAVRVFGASMTDVNNYKDILVAEGYDVENESNQYQFSKGIFGQLQITVSYGDLNTNGYFTITYRTTSGGYERYDSLSSLLQDISKDSLIWDHEYPELISASEYIYVGYPDGSIKAGIYVEEGSAYFDALISGTNVEYSPLYGAYLFTDETNGDYCFAIQAEMVSGGVRFIPMVVETTPYGMVSAADADDFVINEIESCYSNWQSEDPTKYARVLSDVVSIVDNVTDYNDNLYITELNGYGPTVKIYSNNPEGIKNELTYEISSNMSQYTYSSFLKGFVDEVTNVGIKIYTETDYQYNNQYVRIEYQYDTTFVDFNKGVAYFTDLQSKFASFPLAARFIELTPNHAYARLIANQDFDKDEFIDNLVNAGFVNSNDQYIKIANNTLYSVHMEESYGDDTYKFDYQDGYTYLEFQYVENYTTTYAAVMDEIDGVVDANLVNSLPTTISNDSSSFHQTSGSNYLELTVLNSYNKASFLSQLETAGFTAAQDENHYEIINENFVINAYVSDIVGMGFIIRFYCQSYNWQSAPNYYEFTDGQLYFWAHEYMPLPDETGAIYSVTENSYDCFRFLLKSTVNLNAYISKLEAAGFSGKGDKDYYYLNKSFDGFMLFCAIEQHENGIPTVEFRYEDYGGHKLYKGEYFEDALDHLGFTGATLPTGFDVSAYYMYFNSSENYVYINFDGADEELITQLVALMDSTSYDKAVSGEGYEVMYTYTLTSGGLNYTIHLGPYQGIVNIAVEQPNNP